MYSCQENHKMNGPGHQPHQRANERSPTEGFWLSVKHGESNVQQKHYLIILIIYATLINATFFRKN